MQEARRRIAAWIPGERLNLSHLRLSSLPDLPAGLERLDCWNNQLTSLGDLPRGLKWLDCGWNFLGWNHLTPLPNLPGSLEVLDCSHNLLTSLENLPRGLKRLSCHQNRLISLPDLPGSLEVLNCRNNPLPFFSIRKWRKVQTIRRTLGLLALFHIQRTWRRRLIRKRARTKDLINYAIVARPGLGMDWFEACREVGVDLASFDIRPYQLRARK